MTEQSDHRKFNLNDTVIYGINGVCTITEITARETDGITREYYVLKPVFASSTTFFVPTDNQQLTARMRRILSVEEIIALIKSMPEQPELWIADDNRRKEAYRDIINRGDRSELISLIKTLYNHQQQLAAGKKLHVADERLFKDAQKMLHDEFALVLKIEPEQVVPLILDQLDIDKLWPRRLEALPCPSPGPEAALDEAIEEAQ